MDRTDTDCLAVRHCISALLCLHFLSKACIEVSAMAHSHTFVGRTLVSTTATALTERQPLQFQPLAKFVHMVSDIMLRTATDWLADPHSISALLRLTFLS